MKDQRVYLKIKIKSLAAEAKIIRAEEHKHTKPNSRGFNETRLGLRGHRVGIVRGEARHTLLAYGFLRERAYSQMEPTSSRLPNWERVWKMVEKYGVCWDWSNEEESSQDLKKRQAAQKERFEAWVVEAKNSRRDGAVPREAQLATPSLPTAPGGNPGTVR